MNRNLLLLWVGQFISQLGDALMSAVLVFLVLALSPDALGGTRAGLVQLASTLPFLLLSPISGVLADRVDRRRLMLVSDLGRAAILLSVPLIWHAGLLSWLVLAAAAFAASTFSTAFLPARDALVPDLAQGASLLKVNALLQSSYQIAMVAGMLIAAAVLGIAGAGKSTPPGVMVGLIGADGLTFVVSGVCLYFVRTPPKPMHVGVRRSGIAVVLKSPLFRALLFLTAVDNFFIMGPAVVGSGLLIRNTLGLQAGHLALFEACLAGGWLYGTTRVARYARVLPKGKLLLAGMFLDGATYVPFYWIKSFPLLCVAVFLHGFTIPFITAPRTALVQEHVEPAMRAQAFSLVQLTVVGFTSLSVAASGYLGDRFGAPALFLGAGLGAMVGLAGVLSRELRRA